MKNTNEFNFLFGLFGLFLLFHRNPFLCSSQTHSDLKCPYTLTWYSHFSPPFSLSLTVSFSLKQAKYNTTSLAMNVCERNRRVEINYVENSVQVFFDAKGPCGGDSATAQGKC